MLTQLTLGVAGRVSAANALTDLFQQYEAQMAAVRERFASITHSDVAELDDDAGIEIDDGPQFVARWITTIAWFIPIEVLEPAFGDIYQQSEQMRRDGKDQVMVTGFLVLQAISILFAWLLVQFRLRSDEE
jgi:hypothetical protein